jgi:hypothetical protein
VGDRGLPTRLAAVGHVLLAAGERVVRVPPHRMGASRKGERGPGKSDEIDALELARAVVKDGVDGGPLALYSSAPLAYEVDLVAREGGYRGVAGGSS